MPRGIIFAGVAYLALLTAPMAAVSQTNQDASQLLLGASQAFAGRQGVSSVTLNGEATFVAGSMNDSGTITLVARQDGSSSLTLDLSSGARTETQDTFANGQGCTWSGSDGTVHESSGHNCMIPVAWFLPEVALFSTAQPSDAAMTIVPGQPPLTDLHWALSAPASMPADQAALIAHVGSYDLQFDPTTFLPAALLYTLHPDSNAGVDIPVRVTFADYRPINGATIPFRIQRYVNGVLSLDITVSDAVVTR